MENQVVGAAESAMAKEEEGYKSDSSSNSSKSVNSPGLGTDTKVVSRLGNDDDTGLSNNLNVIGSQQQQESDKSSTGSNKQIRLEFDASQEEGNLKDSKSSSEIMPGPNLSASALQGTAIALAADHAVLNISQVPSQEISVVLADANISPTSSSTSSSTISGENAEEKLAKKSGSGKKKPKSEKSVVHDTKEGVWRCRRCGWIYPNPRPSAKHRREHRKQCGKFQSVHAWLGRSEQDGEAEDLKAFVNVEHLQIKAYVSQDDDTASSEDPHAEEETTQSGVAATQGGGILLVSPRVEVHLPSAGISINGVKMPRAAVTELSSDEAADIQQPSTELSSEEAADIEQASILQNAEVATVADYGKLEDENLDENGAIVLQHAVNTADTHEPNEETTNEAGVFHRVKEDTAEIGEPTEDMKLNDQSAAGRSMKNSTTSVQSSKEKMEYVDLKKAEPQDFHRNAVSKVLFTSDVASTSNSGDVEHDVEAILRQQTTHHLLCPNCGSCITKRVILRKRKRISVASVDTEQEKLPKVDEPLVLSTGGVSEEIQQEQNVAEEDGESEGWGCLACFSVFYRRVRGIRRSRDGLNEPLLEKAEGSPVQDRAHHFSCLPFLLPDFAWNGKGGTSEPVQESSYVQIIQEETPDREGSRCLPLKFPWTNDKNVAEEHTRSGEEIEVDLARPPEEDDKKDLFAKSEQEAEKPPFTSGSSKPSEEVGGEGVHEQETRDVPPTSWEQAEPAQDATEEDKNSASSSEVTTREEEKGKDESVSSSQQTVEAQVVQSSEAAQEEQQIDEKKAGFNCFPVFFPSSQEVQNIEEVQSPESKEKTGLSCLPVLLPAYSWGSSEASTTQLVEETDNQNSKEKAGLNCLPALLPAYSWDATEKATHEAEEEQNKENVEIVQAERATNTPPGAKPEAEIENRCIPIAFPNYSWRLGNNSKIQQEEDSTVQERTFITRDTRIRAWIRTITNVVTVKPSRDSADKIDTVQVGNTTNYVDIKLRDQPEALGRKPPPEVLTTTTSTGWALLDALDKEKREEDQLVGSRKRPSLPPAPVDDVNEEINEETEIQEDHLVDNRKRPPLPPATLDEVSAEISEQTEIQEDGLVDNRKRLPLPPASVDKISAEISEQTEIREDKEIAPVKPSSFDYMDEDLRRPLLADSEKQTDWKALISTITENQGLLPEASPKGPVSATVTVESSDSLIQEDTKEGLETALAITGVIADTQQQTKVQEYVKSIVYGGLDVSLTSLAVVSSAAGADTKTVNLFALSLANIIAGLITLFHNIGSLYQNDRASFEKCVGQSLWINGSLAVLSFIVFGCIAPVTYAFSFRSLDDRDYKFAATAVASLACLLLLGLGKAHVQKKGYTSTIINLILTGFVASMAGYFVGDYLKRWLHKIGFVEQPAAPPQEPPPSPPPPPPPFPFFPHLEGLVLGRRGITLI